MMSVLPESTMLGKLEMIEVYDFYDKPALFSCKNQSGQIFIVLWVDSSEVSDIWLYASVSSDRFKSIRKGEIQLRNIFINSEDAFVYKVATPYEENLNFEVTTVYCEQIENDYLPISGQVIEVEGHLKASNIEQVSHNKKREIIDFILEFASETAEAPIGELGFILSSLQETIDAIGQIKLGKVESHIIPSEVTQKTQIVISSVFSGSFGMRLEGIYEEDILGESLLEQCISEFIDLINLGANAEQLRAKLYILKKKTAFKYGAFLNALSRVRISKLHIDWASPKAGINSGEITLETVEKTLNIINNTKLKTEVEIQVNVKVTMVNYQNRTINVQDINSNKKYKCIISDFASRDVDTISKSSIYVATIQDYVILSPVVDKEKHEYELLSLKSPDQEKKNKVSDGKVAVT
jgi:hypothetical protein